MKRLLATIACVTALWGCDRESAPAPPAPAVSTAKPAPAPVDRRDQYALARDIATAQVAQDDPDALPKVIKSWQGRRYRWELAFLPALCRSAESCVVAPFDHQRFERRMALGWLPRLELDKATYAAIQKRCRGHQQCILEVDARLTKLRLSSELPTQLTLAEVKLEGTRDARPGESWIVSRAKIARR